MADLMIGCTYDRGQALRGAVDKIGVDDGDSYAVGLSFLPTASRAVYVVIEGIADSDAASATISGHSSLTLENVSLNGDSQGTETTVTVTEGDIVRAVFSRLDDGNETSVSEDISLVFAGAAPA